MLEFLKGYNRFHIYERAENMEITLKAYDAITPMATFVEAVFKAAYADCYNYSEEDEQTLRNLSLSDLFSDSGLRKYLKKEYRLPDSTIDSLDRNVRKKSNFFKHDVDPYAATEAFRMLCFKSVFQLARGYYYALTSRTAPDWSDAQFKSLYDSAPDETSREKLAEQSGIIKDLREKINSANKEKSEANKQIADLTRKLEDAQLSKADSKELDELRGNVVRLENEINDASGRSVLLKEQLRAALQEKRIAERNLEEAKRLSEEDSAESQNKILEMERIIADAEARAEEYRSSNEKLLEEKKQLLRDKLKADRKIAELGEATANASEVESIEQQLEEARAKKDVLVSHLQEMESRLADVEKEYKDKSSELEKLNELYHSNEKKKATARKYLSENAPKCPKCGSPLEFANSQYGSGFYWKCPNFSSKKCSGHTHTASGEETKIIDEYNSILFGIDPKKIYRLPPEKLKQSSSTGVAYSPYPNSLYRKTPVSYLFQSIATPEEVFLNRHQNNIEKYSKFIITTRLNPSAVERKKHRIYSLALRLLNRGVVIKEYEETAEALKDRFNKNDFGSLTSLTESLAYSKPENAYDSEREKAFAEYYFPRLLGDCWASYVISQPEIDVLIPADESQFKDQRVDFYLCIEDKKVVVELDGPEHAERKRIDEYRDQYLRRNGYTVLRFSNSEVDARADSITERLRRAIGEIKTEYIDADIDERYLVSSKLCHQFAVAIIKCLEKGYITTHANLKAEVSSSLFSSSDVEFILHVAIAEVYSILKNYAILYGIEESWDFLDAYAPETWLCIGNGKETPSRNVLIRDCFLPYNILCEVDDFGTQEDSITPNLDAMEFFLKYIFDIDSFRPGQYEAVSRLLRKKDSIVLLPTGSGKSLIYQLSSFLVPGLIVVVAPLISLIEDQVNNLESKSGITNTIYFASAVTRDEKEYREKSRVLMQNNVTSLIYLAPERLMIPSFRKDARALLKHNSVFAVAIDEAHCVSEWGHDFRPAYLNVGNAAREIFTRDGGTKPVLSALTGTASDAVLNDVRLDLGIRGNDALIQPDSFDRPELHFSVRISDSENKAYHIASIIESELPQAFNVDASVFSELKGDQTYSGIVFTPYARGASQYSAMQISSLLQAMLPAYKVEEYYSSTPKGYEEATWRATIKENARRFKDNETNILVATKAFGMGIDKPNIRFIVHDGLPSSFEQYYQEAGRAGRDRNRAECILLLSNDNAQLNEQLLNPELSLAAFKELYEEYKKTVTDASANDDVTSLLFFHNNSFKGTGDEIALTGRILELIVNDEFTEGKVKPVTLPSTNSSNNEDADKTEQAEIQGSTTEWIQAMVRLVILGIIKDYTYDYSTRSFTVTCGSLDKESVSSKYASYVSGNVTDKKRIEREKSLIDNIDASGVEFAKKSVEVLVNYIYDNIEQSRRRAIYEMFDAVKQAAEKNVDDQDAYLRERITQYFTYSGENRDKLKAIEEGSYAGIIEASVLFDMAPEKNSFSEEEKAEATRLYVLAGRVLESKPDHPGLLLAQATARMVSEEFNRRTVTNNIVAAIKYAKERYLVEDDVLKSSLIPVLNLALRQSPDMFEDLLEHLSAQINFSQKELLAEMIGSDSIGDDNREYLLASYAFFVVKEKKKHIYNLGITENGGKEHE